MGKMTKESIGDVIRKARQSLDLSQDKFAERAGISLRGLQDLEYSKNEDPRISTVLKIFQITNLSLDEILLDKKVPSIKEPEVQIEFKALRQELRDLKATIEAQSSLSPDESELLRLYRQGDDISRKTILLAAQKLTPATPAAKGRSKAFRR